MKHCYRLAAFIAVCFAVCEGGITRREEIISNETYVSLDSESWVECYTNKHENCVVPNLDQYDSSLGNARVEDRIAFLRSRSNVENVAESLLATKTCLQNETEQSYCQNVSAAHNIDPHIAFMADFLASSDHIDLLVNFTNSECLSNPQIFRMASSIAYNCVAGLFSDLQDPDRDPCDSVGSLRDCFVDTSSNLCGAGVGAFVGAVWDYMVHSDYGRDIIRESPIPGSVISMCFAPEQDSIAKRFTRAFLLRTKE